MKALLILFAFLPVVATYAERQVAFDSPGQIGSKWSWLSITLTEAENEILASRSTVPKTALDYYLLLPRRYFGNVAQEIERRITFIETETLSDQYLQAKYTIPTTDAGAFEITIRLFEKGGEPIIAISHLKGSERLYMSKQDGTAKLRSITLRRPEFWRYRNGAFLRQSDSILPDFTVEEILDRYRNHYKAHLNHATQQKSIYLTYDLPPDGNTMEITGRENFMSPSKKYVWATFVYDGVRFTRS